MERLISSLRVQANRNALTGLYNRRMFDQHVATVVDQTQSAGGEICLIMLDLDNFKLLNDTLGHGAGDEFLRAVGQLIRSGTREQDMAFRCGGDEFVIVLPGASLDSARAIAQRLAWLINALGRTHKLERHVGVSAGVAAISEVSPPTIGTLIQEADRRLYESKQSRRRTA